VIPAPDGGYIVGGETKPVWQIGGLLMRIDDNGDVIWEKIFPAGSPNSGIPTPDGNFLIGGQSLTTGGFYLLKVDGTGSAIWEKTIRHEVHPWVVYSIALATGGGYIVTGLTHPTDYGYVARVDESGEVVWEKTYGGSARDVTYSVCRAHCGGYIVAGWTASSGSGSGDVWIFKIDESGAMLWERTYGGSLSDDALSVAPTPDGGYIVGARTLSYGNGGDFWILKVDDEGRLAE
jgi:hypothetical protein